MNHEYGEATTNEHIKERKDRINEMFQTMDTDRDGKITREEWLVFFDRLYGEYI